MRAFWSMKLALEGDLHKRHTSGGNKILLIKNLNYQDVRATQPNFTWSFDAVSKKSTCCFSKPKYIRLRGRKQEKIRDEFSQNNICF